MIKSLLKVEFLAMLLLTISLQTSSVAAQTVAQADHNVEDQMITLSFPEKIELRVLIEYVSDRLGMNILYDEQVATNRIAINAPSQIPQDSLLGLFESILKMKRLALIDSDQPGWKRIVQVSNLVSISQQDDEIDYGDVGPGLVLTRVFKLRHTTPDRANLVITSFLTQPSANALLIPEQKLIIVTDYATNMKRIAEMIAMVDQPALDVIIELVPVVYQDAQPLSVQIKTLMAARANVQKNQGLAAQVGSSNVEVTFDARTNQIVLVGMRENVDQAIKLIKSLDSSLGLETKVYQFKVANPERVDRLTKDLIGPLAAKRLYRSSIDKEAGLLIVSATEEVHKTVDTIKEDLDVPLPESHNPVHFYKLANTTAQDVLNTILSLTGDERLFSGSVEQVQDAGGAATSMRVMPDIFAEEQSAASSSEPALRSIQQTLQAGRATVTADENTNSIIVVASPRVQQVYKKLIERLDRRRPQVLIEVTIAVLDTTDDFSLGVELGHEGTINGVDTLLFSSFGLTSYDAETGVRSLVPGLGFNGAVIDDEVLNVVIRAFKSDRRARLVSAPRILVNDNATGILSSIAEEPFASVNASTTVSTTSFGGFVKAGTEIHVTPHISEDEHLNLKYTVTLNSFTDDATENTPPPRQTNLVESEVTIPDGHTVIIGGLKSLDYSNTVRAIPLLGEIPVIKRLFSSETQEDSEVTLFVFIRPVILRDDKFEDLKLVSQEHIEKAGLPGDYPTSEPLTAY